ncbi:MAG: acetoin utilization protein AcuC [Actinomycetota bacterium]
MSGGVGLVRCPGVAAYDHGPGHPLRPDRVRYAWDLIDAVGLSTEPGVVDLAARRAVDEEIGLVHSDAYITATRSAGQDVPGSYARWGYGPGDNPVFPRMHDAAADIVGASLVGAEAVWRGDVLHAFNAAGGLHHAMPERASGFCVYDDPAVAIAWLLAHGAERIAYVDLDVHHGDGPQAIFWHDPRVLTVSIHESGETLFPGTGARDERGAGLAKGTKVNVPLPAGTGDRPWLRAIDEVVLPVVADHRPQVLVTQLGCDSHLTDPLAHLEITTTAYAEAARRLHRLAHDTAGGRWLATGGGGYQRVTVVPRAWTIDFAAMVGVELDDRIPDAWRRAVATASGTESPATFSDPPVPEMDVHADRAVDEAREGALKALGLAF